MVQRTNDGPFVAIESWSGLSPVMTKNDVFEHKRGVMKAAPGERKQLTFSITITVDRGSRGAALYRGR